MELDHDCYVVGMESCGGQVRGPELKRLDHAQLDVALVLWHVL